MEYGGDIGFAFFGYAKILISGSPRWTLSYQTTDFHPEDTAKLTELTSKHRALGVRVEVPLVVLESMPQDRLVEIGPMLSYQLDTLYAFELKPLNFTPTSSDTNLYNQEATGTQKTGYRWLLGVFVNVRL